MNIKDELLKELSTIDYKNGMNIDTIKLNTDLGVKIIENVVKKLIIGGVSNQKELLDWLSDETDYNIRKSDVDEILQDFKYYQYNYTQKH
jgi:hypothetical protein